MKIGITSYINTLPFTCAFKKGILDFGANLIFAPPTTLNHMLKNDELDIALVSSVEYLQNHYQLLSPFGIAAKGSVLSVHLYTKHDHPSICGVTNQSATSVKLLQVIATKFWKKKILLEPLKPTHDSFLLIGDEALEKQHIPMFKTIDLSSVWHEHTNLGFVFAVFAAKKENDETKIFCEKLKSSLDWAKDNFEEVLKMAKTVSTHDTSFLEKYFRSISYTLDEDHLKGLKLFGEYLKDV